MSFSRVRGWLGRSVLAAWFVGMVVVGSGLLAKHLVALPVASAVDVAPAMNALRDDAEKNQWLAVHVLSVDCRCSRRIAEHLAQSDRPRDWKEIVLWVGDGPIDVHLDPAHFDVRRISVADLVGAGVEAAPSLLVLDPEGHVRYSGGYTDRKQGVVVADVRILDAVHRGEVVDPLPLFGCAVSDRLQGQLASLPTP
ncbi:MAG TPA: hypothetical protein VF407_21965 [Polyangiaceae bacterium]